MLPLFKGHAADRRRTPQRDLRVAVFATDVGVDVAHRESDARRDELTEAGRIENRAGTDDTLRRHAQDVHRGHRRHVDGVGDHQEDGVRRALCQRGQHRGHELHRRFGEVHAGLAGLLFRARGDDDDVGILGVCDVCRAADDRFGHELPAVHQVKGFGLDLLLVDVLEYEVAGDPADESGIGEGRAHCASADDGNLCTFTLHDHAPSLADETSRPAPLGTGLRSTGESDQMVFQLGFSGSSALYSSINCCW